VVERFVNDDAGYVAWLASHPTGFVLNTYPHVTSSYLVLHRASCRTVNRPLESERSWTRQYGKACAELRVDLEKWAAEATGRAVVPHLACLGAREGSARVPRVSGNLGGGRRPHPAQRIEMVGAPIVLRVDVAAGRPPLVIEGAQWLAETFFRRDPSAVGPNSYDRWIEATQRDPTIRDRVLDGDVTAVNRTMAARTGHGVWAPIVESIDWTWLQALSTRWDLLETSSDEWSQQSVADHLRRAFSAVQRPGIGVAVATKVLHIKRPRLIPVLDSVVLAQIGARVTADVATWVTAVERVRAVAVANELELRAIGKHLVKQALPPRSHCRVLDAILWTASAGAGLYGSLTDWEQVLRPRSS
jgi:hypothetical protein